MKVLVTGVKGQLGYDVMKVLKARNISCIGAGSAEFDVTDFEAASNFIKSYHPDAVIHCAAYTAVDKAEDNLELCHAVNAQGSRNIAEICSEIDAKMVYISTDYVFPGSGDKPYEVDDPKGPLNAYGKTKLEGEQAVGKLVEKHFIIRTSWVFGKNGVNFVKTILRIGKEQDEVSVVCDQVGSPTYTGDLAALISDMVVTEKYGTYHATNEGFCSWAEFAAEIFRQAGYKTKVNFIPTSVYSAKAVRPINSRLSKRSLDDAGFVRLPHWKDALKCYLHEEQYDD